MVIDAERHYITMVQCKPREPEIIFEIDISKNLIKRWAFDNSWFKDFEPDSEMRLKECLDFDIKVMKLPKCISDDIELYVILLIIIDCLK